MKRLVFVLLLFCLIGWQAACTPTLEPAYEPVTGTPHTETAVPTPTLALLKPTVMVTVATAVPAATFTPTIPPTDVPPDTPTPILPTATATAVPPIDESAQVITTTLPVASPLPIVQTPTPGWYYYLSDLHGLVFQYPAHWLPESDFPYGLQGSDGFVRLLATNSQDNLLVNACNDAAVGTAVPIEWLTAAGQESCLIQTDDGRQATLIVHFPELRENIVPGVAYAFLVLQADPVHMPSFIQTLAFFTPAAPTPEP